MSKDLVTDNTNAGNSEQSKETIKPGASHLVTSSNQGRGGSTSVRGMHFTRRPWLLHSSLTDRHHRPYSSNHNNYAMIATTRGVKPDVSVRKYLSQKISALSCSSKASCSKTGAETMTEQSSGQNNKLNSSVTKRTLDQLSHLTKEPSENSVFTPIIYSTSPSKLNLPTEPSMVLTPSFVSANARSIQDKDKSPAKNTTHEVSTSKSPTSEESQLSPQSDQCSGRQSLSSVSHKCQNSDYLVPFVRGSIIQLGDGELKCVEEISTKDLIQSAEITGILKAETCTVSKISKKNNENVILELTVDGNAGQIQIESSLEHPFFVANNGWASCNPDRTKAMYDLECKALLVGDVCVFLSSKENGLSQNSIAKNHNSSKTKREFDKVGNIITVPKSENKRTEKDDYDLGKTKEMDSEYPQSDSTRVKRRRRWSMSDVVISEQQNHQSLPTVESLETVKANLSCEN